MDKPITASKLNVTLQLFPLPGPGINPFDMTFPSLARLHAGEPLTVSAYQAEKERVWSRLMNQVKRIKQFSPQRAELALAVWDAWVRSGGSFTDAAVILKWKTGRVFSRQALYHRIKCLMRAGIIPHHRSRRPTRNRVGITNGHRFGQAEVDSVAISA